MPEGQGLYLLELVPKVVIQTCCSCASYTSVRVGTDRSSASRIVGWDNPIQPGCTLVLAERAWSQH